MRHKTDELEGGPLGYAVAKAAGIELMPPVVVKKRVHRRVLARTEKSVVFADWNPAEWWDDAGPIIEGEKIELEYDSLTEEWRAVHPKHYSGKLTSFASAHGDRAVVAAMRAFVKSKLGEEVELP
jgi:hypothetical protein